MAIASYRKHPESPWEQERNLQQNRNREWEKACVDGIKCTLSRAVQDAVERFLDCHFRAEELQELCAYKYMPMEKAACVPPSGARYKKERSLGKRQALEDLLQKRDSGFSETLLKLIDSSGNSDPEIYKRANISRQLFSKIRNNPDHRPTKATALALAIALELDLEATKDLIGRAGYALSNSSKFDLIVRFFIEEGFYDVMQINLVLYEYDQPLLGG